MSANKKAYNIIDGEILIQPSVGEMEILTECGVLELRPGIIGVIPKNMKF
jgi:homogentisate 1,2-dioxygenase